MTNWPTKKLGEVLEYEQPTKYLVSSTEYKNEYPTPVLTAGKTFILGNTNEKKGIFPKKKLPVIIFDDFTTAIKFVDFPFKVKSSAMKILHAKKDIADVKYVFYAMQTTELNHATHKRYWISEYSKLEIPLPFLAEQKKIVAKLESVLAKISEAKKLRAEARENADNLLSAELHKIFEEGKKKGWEEKELRETVNEIKSGFACGKLNEVSNGVVHLRTHNIDTEGNLNFDKITQIPKNLIIQSAFGLKEGDILFNNTNSTELVGKTALITEELPYAFSNHLTRIKVNRNKALPEWIVYVFNTFWKDRYFESICTRWVGQSGINQTALKKIKIPLPPLVEQKKIVGRLDSLSRKIADLRQLQAKTQNDFIALEQSILSKAFNNK